MMYLAIIATLIIATRSQPVAECEVDLECATGEVCDFPGTPIATCAPQCENSTVCHARYAAFLHPDGFLNETAMFCVNDGSVDKCGVLLCQADSDCREGICSTFLAPVVRLCVECEEDSQCNSTSPICDAQFESDTSFECVQCLADADCVAGEEYCNTDDSSFPYCETTCEYEESLDAAYCSDMVRNGVCDPAFSNDCVTRDCYPADISNCSETVIDVQPNWNVSYNVTFPDVCNTDESYLWWCESASCSNTDGYCAAVYPLDPYVCSQWGDCDLQYCLDDSYCDDIPYPNCIRGPWGPDYGYCLDVCTVYEHNFCYEIYGDDLIHCNAVTGVCQNVDCSADADCSPYGLVCNGGTNLCDYGCANQTQCDNNYSPGSGYICQDSGLCELDSCIVDADCNSTETFGFVCADNLCVEGCRDTGGDAYCFNNNNDEFISLCNNDTGLCAPIPCATYDNCSVYDPNYTCGDDWLCTYGCSITGCDPIADDVPFAFWPYYICDVTDEQCRVDPPGCADDAECAVTFGNDTFLCNDNNTCWESCDYDQDCWREYGWNSVCVAGEGCTVDEGCLVHGCGVIYEIINMIPEAREHFNLPSDFVLSPLQIPCNDMFINMYECDVESIPIWCASSADCDEAHGYVCSTIQMPTDAADPYGSLSSMCVLACSDDDVCDELWATDMAVAVNGGAPTTCTVATGQCSYTDECDNDCEAPFNLCLPIEFMPKFCVTTCASDTDCDAAWGGLYGVGTVSCADFGVIGICDMTEDTFTPTRTPTESPTESPTLTTTEVLAATTKEIAGGVARCGIFGAIAFVFVVVSRMF